MTRSRTAGGGMPRWGKGAVAAGRARRRWTVVAPLLLVWVAAFPFSASSFALRNMEKGSQVPDLEFAGLTGEGGRLSSFAGTKGLVVVYWASWSSRSPEILSFFDKELRRYEKMGFRLLAVNADHQEMKAEDIAAARAAAAGTGVTFPVVLDQGLKGYNTIGIISMPTTIFLDRSLKIIDVYPGFPTVARDEIPARLDAYLGIVREKPPEKARYLLEHRPKNYALQYYNLGKQLFLSSRSPSGDLKAVPTTAIERIDEAIRRDPAFFRPYLLKAVIFDMVRDDRRLEEVLGEMKKHEFQEVYERRLLGIGYLLLRKDPLAEDHFKILSSQVPEDPVVLFAEGVLAARRKDGTAARKAVDALAKNPKAAEAMGFDPFSLFTPEGGLRAGTEAALRSAFEKILEIEKPPSAGGGLRRDAPAAVPSAAPAATPSAASPPSVPRTTPAPGPR